MGQVRLTVADLDASRAFYERVVGLATLASEEDIAGMGVAGTGLVELRGTPDAPARPAHSTGLFHLAILVPDRPQLASALRRVAEAGWRLTGASDHLVSEALYLNDPEGNGIEIYRDRPRSEWRRDPQGELLMGTFPLDLDDLLAEPATGDDDGMPPGTAIGHVHLNVADISESEVFYAELLGFEVTVRGYPGALFVSAGGYHHHLGLNTWRGEGAPPPPDGARGLDHYEVLMPGVGISEVSERLGDAGVAVGPGGNGDLRLADPSGNGILIRPEPSPG